MSWTSQPAVIKPERQGLLDAERIGTEIMADYDFGLNTALMKVRAKRQPQRLHANKIDVLRIQPARIIFAEAGLRDQRLCFKEKRVGLEPFAWNSKHAVQS